MPHWITAESSTISHKPQTQAHRNRRGENCCAMREPLRQSRCNPLDGGAHFDAELRDFRRMQRRRGSRHPDGAGPHDTARSCAPSTAPRAPAITPAATNESSKARIAREKKASRTRSPAPQAQPYSAARCGGTAAARTNKKPPSAPRAGSAGDPAPRPHRLRATASVPGSSTPIESRNLRHSQKRNTTSAPTCSPATTSTWYAAVF